MLILRLSNIMPRCDHGGILHADCLTCMAYSVAGGDAEQSNCVQLELYLLGVIDDGQNPGGAD